uniref:27 kDa hemolymph protein n=1 Tax=Galleria mellonella TaxID=7137 RepID=P27K_GALME|nr:RecName: Full=27 kDa hemolymph protein; AltName: Full=P27K; Short=27k; Flags: Precursor [Galleria mellonella]CAE02611.1 27k hemolymph protein [Galleria mellonella]
MMWKLIIVTILAVGVLCDDIATAVNEQTTQQIRDTLKAQCKKNGAEDKAQDVENAAKNFVECVKGLFDFSTIKKEIEDAKPNGALDEVFGKYCAKSPQLKTCIHTLTTSATPCLEASVREQVGPINNGADQLIDFICYKDGDRIALFIAEGGPECFQEKSEGIRACAEKLKNNVGSVEAAQSLTLVEQCGKYDELTACIIKSLEECSTPTPGNMAESLFRFVRKGSPCNKAAPLKN